MAQITGVEGRVLPPTEDDWNRVIGSYHLRVCQRGGMCADDAGPDVLLTYFVSIQRHQIQLNAAERYRVAWTWHFWPLIRFEGLNACYAVLRTIRHAHPMYASPVGAGLFPANPEPGPTVSLVLGGGAMDEFYLVDAVSVDGRLEGIGHSYDAPKHESDSWPKDTVVAVRTGPPDMRPCIDVAPDSVLWRGLRRVTR
jgi:hypothetical protein